MILQYAKENIVYLIVEKKLEAEDYEVINEFFKIRTEKFGKLNCYIELKNLQENICEHSCSGSNFKFLSNWEFRKIAIVSYGKIEEDIDDLLTSFTSPEFKYFRVKDKAEAKIWIEDYA